MKGPARAGQRLPGLQQNVHALAGSDHTGEDDVRLPVRCRCGVDRYGVRERDVATGEPPVLLLDDVLSELDVAHRSMIVASIATRQVQVCVTATDESDLASSQLGHLSVIRTEGGGAGIGHVS